MKIKKRFLVLNSSLLMLLAGCSGGSLGGISSTHGGDESYFYSDDDYKFGPEATDDGGRTKDISVESEGYGKEDQDSQISAGQLTAKALFDNEDDRYEYFTSLLTDDEQTKGEFCYYQDDFKLDYKRIKVTVKDVPYAKVTLLDADDDELWNSVCDINGECYLFSNSNSSSKVRVTVGEESKVYDVDKNLVVTDFRTDATKYDQVQVLFDIDTTGSMSDEIKYLKAELTDVITKIEDGTNADVEVGFVTYRDKGDEYVTKTFNFNNDIDEALSFLNKQFASGGGDFPEAVHSSYAEAKQLSWDENATKIIIHVADAPSHDNEVKEWFNHVSYFSEIGARILTVASSGIDKKTEYLFRMQSLQTNGCYAYLTDDSGIGNGHLEASTLEEVPTEYLNDLLVRVIKGFHNGSYDLPKAFDISDIPELLELNKKISLGKAVQGVIVKKYIAQFANAKEGAKGAIKYAFVNRNIPFVYMDDNFMDVNETPCSEIVAEREFKYPDSTRKILVFNGTTFAGLQEALDNKLIEANDIEELYKNVIKSEVFKDLYLA